MKKSFFLPSRGDLTLVRPFFSSFFHFSCRRGFTRQPKRAHLRVPALRQTPPKFHEKTSQEKKERKMWREKEKSVKCWALPTLRSPTLRGPLGLGTHLPGPTKKEHTKETLFDLSRVSFFLTSCVCWSRSSFFILSRMLFFGPWPSARVLCS